MILCGQAAASIGKKLGVDIQVRLTGPRRDYEDHIGDWTRAREVGGSGCILVRPDHNVAWRAAKVAASAENGLTTALMRLLGH
jgi:2,4-dichlorophenol 6-monooxygenase